MTTFPVTASTLSAKALGQFIKERYNLSADCDCTLFRTGINHTYFITDGSTKYALRVYSHNWRSESDILEEINLLNVLKENGIGVSYPIADINNNFIQTINAPEGTRYAVLFSFAEGDKIRIMDTETCFSIGSLMAKFHNITVNRKSDRMQYDTEALLKLPYKYATVHFSEELPEMKFIKQQIEELSPFFEKTDLNSIPKGIVHMDIWYDNMNVTAENKVTLFDFDFCGNGMLIFDVAYFYKQLFHIEANKDEYELKVQRFLKGYQSVRNLSAGELQLIPKAGVALWIYYLGVQSSRFDWSNIFLTENYLKILFVGRIKSWIEYHEAKAITKKKL